MRADSIDVYTGNANPELASKIARYLGRELGKAEVFAFANENIFVKILDNAREKDVFIVQPTSRPVSTSIMELLIMIDAFKRASAGRITAVIPYYGYGRSDKKDQPRVPITARLVADMLQVAGANRILTMDLHQGQLQGFFNVPVDELTAVHMLSNYIRQKGTENLRNQEALIPPLTARITTLETINKDSNFPKALTDLLAQKLNDKFIECDRQLKDIQKIENTFD